MILRIALAGCLTSVAMAADGPPVLLSGPEIARVAWDTSALGSADFDGDGKLDAALINNENAKIVLLYQRTPGTAQAKSIRRAVSRNRWEPVVEDSRFEKVSIPSDQRHFALAAGDFNGDGRVDLALTGEEDALLVRFQAEDGTFTKTWKWKDFEALPGTEHLRVADLNGDGRADLAVLGKGKLLVFPQKAADGFADPIVYITGEDKAGQLFTEDADGDGKIDLLYLAGGGDGTLRWRRQIGAGSFSAEIALPYSLPAHDTNVSRDSEGRLLLTRVNAKSQLIEQHAFVAKAPMTVDEPALRPTIYNLPAGMKVAAHARADFNGDGLEDVIVADGRAAQVALYLQQADGTFGEPQTFPSFAGINGLAAVHRPDEKIAQLLVASRKEGLGVCRLNAQGRLDFPTAVTLEGEPAAMVASFDASGQAQSAAVLIEHDRKWRLDLLTPDKGGMKASSSRPLAALKREPSGLLAGDLNGDRRSDFLLCVPREAAWIIPGTADGIGEPLKETGNFRSQLSDLAPDRVAIIDLDGDQRGELVTTGTGFGRSLRLVPEGNDLAITDQFNARQPDNRLLAPSFADTDGDGRAELLFAEAGSAFLQVLKKDAAGVYRSNRRLETIQGDVLQATAVSLGKAKVPHLMVVSRERFWTAPFGGAQPRLELTTSYDTDLQDCSYFTAVPADLNGDGQPEVVALDQTSHLLEVLAPTRKTGEPWRSLLHFTLFDENIRFRGRKGESSVREVLIRDFTGDKRDDLLILVHDRVLLYPQG
jgi:hypothetical protein